jgi:hypothetical protein
MKRKFGKKHFIKILAKFGYKLDMKVKYYISIFLYYWLPIGTYDKNLAI